MEQGANVRDHVLLARQRHRRGVLPLDGAVASDRDGVTASGSDVTG